MYIFSRYLLVVSALIIMQFLLFSFGDKTHLNNTEWFSAVCLGISKYSLPLFIFSVVHLPVLFIAALWFFIHRKFQKPAFVYLVAIGLYAVLLFNLNKAV